ncbi:hypothetical protein PVK06_008226 [Gossypium arboreum]|uniref:Uncharacterized protein n=1 Tax=Gossypium arboreum TaxID=29729 RepID=A0ABR0QKM0_GOSAR|nr:hypothetical protein PVK06_008226 [Gossypium arboreum]
MDANCSIICFRLSSNVDRHSSTANHWSGESADGWGFLLSRWRRHVCVISNRRPGILAVIAWQGSFWDRTHHGNCLRHVASNYL